MMRFAALSFLATQRMQGNASSNCQAYFLVVLESVLCSMQFIKTPGDAALFTASSGLFYISFSRTAQYTPSG